MENRLGAAIRRSTMTCMVVGAVSASIASATLLDRGPALVYDDVLDITWTRNANLAGSAELTLVRAHAWAANLVYAGYDDWRLPYASVSSSGGTPLAGSVPCELYSEVACLDNEMGYMYYYNLAGRLLEDKTGNQTAVGGQELIGIHGAAYWTDSAFPPFGNWFFSFEHGGQNVGDLNSEWSAWAVRPGDSAYVPEPSSVLLTGAGMLALVCTRRAFRRACDAKHRVGLQSLSRYDYACGVTPPHADGEQVMP
jgi:hypothetical protein